MVVYVNEKGEIKAVNATEDETLTALEIEDEYNPFGGWSEAKICCYKVQVKDGRVIMMTPYLDSHLLDHIEQLGKQAETAETNADIVTATTDEIMTGVIPELAEADANLTATIDQILTEIIPGLIPEE